MALRHQPQRTCIACRTKRFKRELVRIVRTPAGAVELDSGGRAPGRGAYICRDEACWPSAIKRGALAAQLRVTIPNSTIEELGHELDAARERRLQPTMSD
ncbi:MAG: YlxR family protein [Chloroflexi bacterium]|nr:YlxR family protein [Chloroflexota bacterium]